jgi:hypothetical protein
MASTLARFEFKIQEKLALLAAEIQTKYFLNKSKLFYSWASMFCQKSILSIPQHCF